MSARVSSSPVICCDCGTETPRRNNCQLRCPECARLRFNERHRRPPVSEPRIDAAPVIAAVRRMAPTRNGGVHGSFFAVVADKLGTTPSAAERRWERTKSRGYCAVSFADALCVALGMHPTEVYGWDWCAA